MPRITASAKLACAIGIPLLFLFITAAISYFHVRQIEASIGRIVDVDRPIITAAYEVEINTLDSAFAVLGYAHDRDPDHIVQMEANFEDLQNARQQLASLTQAPLLHSEIRRTQIKKLDELFTTYKNNVVQLLEDAGRQYDEFRQFQQSLDEIDAILDDHLQASIGPNDAQGWAKLRATMEMEININGIAKGLQQFLGRRTSASEDRIDKDEQDFRDYLAAFRALPLSEEERAQTDKVHRAFEVAVEHARSIVELEKDRVRKIKVLVTTLKEINRLVGGEIQTELHGKLQQEQAAIQQLAGQARLMTFGAFALSLILGGGSGFLIAHRMRDSVRRLVAAAEAFGRGETVHSVAVQSEDEMYDIATAFNQMVEDVRFANASLRRANVELEHRVTERTTELSQRNEELEQFAYVASHDLQEPLRKVVSCCQVLAEDHGQGLDDEARRWIDYAVKGALHMQSLVTDLLTYSRLGRKGQMLVAVNAYAACRAAIDHLQTAIEEADARITCQPLPRVEADEMQLTQLFQNLIGNAIKYRGEARPEIEIGIDNDASPKSIENGRPADLAFPAIDIEPGLIGGERNRPRSDFHTFYVRDNGIGIQPEFFDRIFVIFQRLHGKNEYSGTGIGLSLCKKIVVRHGGQIWVESSPGNGSTFYFTLLKAEQDVSLGGASVASPSHHGP